MLIRSLGARMVFVATLGVTLCGGGQPSPRLHASYHVAPAPTGSRTGTGTASRPWDLATALAGARGRIQAGDTVWLHGGRYRGSFRTSLRGDSAAPIVFRQAAGERAIIDGTLRAEGEYLTFWGFEIMQSNPSTYGLEARTNGGRFVNLVIHDAGSMGVSFWTPGINAELYGCIIYNNGMHENLDHGVYVHNERGTKLIADNVFFNNLAYGIHVYATGRNPPQRNVRVEGNIAFNNGTISTRYRAKGNIIVGAEVPMSGMQVLDNLLYFSGSEGENLRLGYAPVANADVVARGNVMWGGGTALRMTSWASAIIEGNTLGGARQLVSGAGIPGRLERTNELVARSRTPAAPAVYVRPNRYEPGRGFVVVYNWRRRPSVKVDLSAVLGTGQSYEVRNVQDLYGSPIARGTYDGDSVSIPMTATVVPPAPINRFTSAPPRTGPVFDVFLVTAAATNAAARIDRSQSRAP